MSLNFVLPLPVATLDHHTVSYMSPRGDLNPLAINLYEQASYLRAF